MSFKRKLKKKNVLNRRMATWSISMLHFRGNKMPLWHESSSVDVLPSLTDWLQQTEGPCCTGTSTRGLTQLPCHENYVITTERRNVTTPKSRILLFLGLELTGGEVGVRCHGSNLSNTSDALKYVLIRSVNLTQYWTCNHPVSTHTHTHWRSGGKWLERIHLTVITFFSLVSHLTNKALNQIAGFWTFELDVTVNSQSRWPDCIRSEAPSGC